MYRLMLVVGFVLAACSQNAALEIGAYRAASVPIFSNAVFDAARMAGSWDQVAAFAQPSADGCRIGRAKFGSRPDAMLVSYDLCLSGLSFAGEGQVAWSGPGRFTVLGKDAIGAEWWVLWVDEGYRTMAIGNPTGTFGFILNRGRDLPADRLKAAQLVFGFNGYETSKLLVFGK